MVPKISTIEIWTGNIQLKQERASENNNEGN